MADDAPPAAEKRESSQLARALQLQRQNWELVNDRVDQLANLLAQVKQEQQTVMDEMRTTMAATQRTLMEADQEVDHLATIADALTRATQEQALILAYMQAQKDQAQKQNAQAE